MQIQEHEVGQSALTSAGPRVLAVGGFWRDFFFPLDAFTADVMAGTVERIAPGTVAPGNPAPAPQTFAGAFGGALGEKLGTFLIYGAIIGGAWYYFKRGRKRK